MSKLNAKERNSLPKSEFAMPKERKYPINDAAHAKNAKARASEMEHKGKITSAEKGKIDSKADRFLGKSRG